MTQQFIVNENNFKYKLCNSIITTIYLLSFNYSGI